MCLILDVDYHDLCLSGNGGLDALDRLFGEAKNAGIDSMLWAPMVCGKALYPSNAVTPFRNTRMHEGGRYLAEILDRFDPLEEAVRLAAEYEMELLFYYRLFDDYYPGLEEDFFERRPDLYWQSRCGDFVLRGWPCYGHSEVRAHKMRLFQELLSYGPSGFMVELGRSHSFFATPHRAVNFFGYDAPIAQEYLRRYGVDIRAFNYAEPVVNSEGRYQDVPYAYSVEYRGATKFDTEAWHWLKGEAVTGFLRELRAQSVDKTLLMQGGICPPHPAAAEEGCAKFYIDANKLAVENTIDGYSLSMNFRSHTLAQIEETFFPYFSGVRECGKPVGAWLNDILTAHGGHGALASCENVREYLEKFQETSLDYLVIHEADFVVRHPQKNEIWELLSRFKTPTLV